MSRWSHLNRQIVECDKCPRLRAHCSEIAETKRRAYLDWVYWGKPVPNFGDPKARLLIVGLAPAAHGANRTGRMFTGDRSGDWLFRALHEAGFANQATATDRSDGLILMDAAITAACHCAPPQNKPTREETINCEPWLDRTFEILPVQVILALGQIGWKSVFDKAKQEGWHEGANVKFGHGQEVEFSNGTFLVGSYHPSQQNTFTGRLTKEMFDSVFQQIKRLLKD